MHSKPVLFTLVALCALGLSGSPTTNIGVLQSNYRQPQLAAYGKDVAVAFGSKETLFVSLSQDGGETFGSPRRIAGVPGLLLGMHRGPRIAFSKSGLVVTAMNGKTDGDLLAWSSADMGRTWTGPVKVNDREKAAREGLHAMVSMPNGRVFATWLDLRNLVPGKPGTELWGSYSDDGGKSWSKNMPVYHSPDGTICQCCHPSLVADNRGALHVMWRNVVAGHRDLYGAVSTDGGQSWHDAAKLGKGTWALNACPMDGGAIAIDKSGKVVSVWRRESSVYLADAQGEEQRLGEGKNPAMAIGRSGPVVVWTSPRGVEAYAAAKGSAEVIAPEGAFPNAIALPDGRVLAAWEHEGTLQFRSF